MIQVTISDINGVFNKNTLRLTPNTDLYMTLTSTLLKTPSSPPLQVTTEALFTLFGMFVSTFI